MAKFNRNMAYTNDFRSASIKIKIYKKLSKLAKKERHTISDQLDILIESYTKQKGGSN